MLYKVKFSGKKGHMNIYVNGPALSEMDGETVAIEAMAIRDLKNIGRNPMDYRIEGVEEVAA